MVIDFMVGTDSLGRSLTFNLTVGYQPMILTIQDPTYLVQVINKSLDQVVEGLGAQIWLQALQRTTLANLELLSLEEINKLMGHTFLNLPFFPPFPYLLSSHTNICTMDTINK